MSSKPFTLAVLPRASIHPMGLRAPRPRGQHARLRVAALVVAVVAALVTGCGGDSAESTEDGTWGEPAPAVEHTSDTANDSESQPAVEPMPEAVPEPQPEPMPEPEPEVMPPDQTASDPEPGVEPESDASRWVDRRQDEVLNNVHENNMDATYSWTP
jgi:outer membrane biosynthesis protein TonB